MKVAKTIKNKPIEKREARENAMMERQKRLDLAGIDERKIHIPEYWKKHRGNLDVEILKELQQTAEAEPVMEDAYGKYKPGTFLHRSFIVTVTMENDLWAVHIFGKDIINQPVIQEVRDKYIPDYCMMIQFYPSRAEREALQGVVLYEMPGSTEVDSPESEAE
jgi:hypothetical protein